MVKQVEKRDGRIVKFNRSKISSAIQSAMIDAGDEVNLDLAEKIALNIAEMESDVLNVDSIHKQVEKGLSKAGFKKTLKMYKSYRTKRDIARKAPSRKAFKDIIEVKSSDVTRENANMNADTPAGMMMKFASENTKPYVMDVLLSEKAKEGIENNLIHVHDLDYFPSRSLTCLSEDTYITLKNENGDVINTKISYFDKYMKYSVGIDSESVVPSDFLYIKGRNGWTKVNAVARRYMNNNDNFYFLKTHKGIGLKVTGSHKIPVLDENNNEVLKCVDDIKVGDRLIGETVGNDYVENEYIDVLSALMGDERIDNSQIVVYNIKTLKKFLNYKYDVTYLSKEIGSDTYRNGVSYLTCEQYNSLKEKYNIPYEVESTLTVKILGTKDSLPLYLPITNELVEVIGYMQSEGSISINEELGNYQLTFVNYDNLMNQRFEDSFKKVFSNHLNVRWIKDEITGIKKETGRLFSSKNLSYLFTNYFGKYSTNNIVIPNFIKNGTDELKWHYISALIDGDGSLKDRQMIRYTTVSDGFANELVILLKSLGVESYIRTQETAGSVTHFGNKESIRNFNTSTVHISGYDNVSKIYENLKCIKQKDVSDEYAERPKKGLINNPYTIVDKIIINKEKVKVYDIETAEHWFVANGYIVHNCLQHPLDRLFEGFNAGHGSCRSPKRIETAAIQACISMETIQNEMHGGQAIPAFDFYLAPYVRKTFIEELNKLQDITKNSLYHLYDVEIDDYLKKNTSTLEGDELYKQYAINNTVERVHQSMEAFVHNAEMIHSRGGNQTVFSSINYGTDTSAEGRCIIREILKTTYNGVGVNGQTAIFPIQVWKKKRGVSYLPSDKNYDLYKLACKVSAKRFFPNFVNLDATYNQHELWREDNPKRYEHEIATMGCRTRVWENRFGDKTSIGRGNLSFTTINIVKLAIDSAIETGLLYKRKGSKNYTNAHREDCEETKRKKQLTECESLFFEKLDRTIGIAAQQLDERFNFQKKAIKKQFPLLMSGMWNGSDKLDSEDAIESVINQGTLGIGFIGLAEALIALRGVHHGESEWAQELGLRIVSHMRDKANEYSEKYQHNYSILATPAEGLSGKFTKNDKEKYGVIEGITDKEYYTNSNHIPVYYKCTPSHKAKIEGPYHNLTRGGHIFYVEMDGDATHNPEAIMRIVDLMDEYNIGYCSVNHNRNRCLNCGYENAEKEIKKCPKCGSENIDTLQRITG